MIIAVPPRPTLGVVQVLELLLVHTTARAFLAYLRPFLLAFGRCVACCWLFQNTASPLSVPRV
jgi:hypothetical protein